MKFYMIWTLAVLFLMGDIWCYAKAQSSLKQKLEFKWIPGSGFYLYLKHKGVI